MTNLVLCGIIYQSYKREENIYEKTNENQKTFNPGGNYAVATVAIPNQCECRGKNQAERHKENSQCGRFLHREAAEQQKESEMVCIEQKHSDCKQEQQAGENQGCKEGNVIPESEGREQDL